MLKGHVPNRFCRYVSECPESEGENRQEGLARAHRGQLDTITGSSMIRGLPVPINALTTST